MRRLSINGTAGDQQILALSYPATQMNQQQDNPHNNGSPLVSIIIPAYNYGRFIGETLSSVRSQTYQNWECIVVDDGSTDNTREVVEQYIRDDHRFRYVYQANAGPGTARDNGLRNAKGKYIQFWDSDDLIERRKIELHVDYLKSHPEVDLVYGSVRYFRADRPGELSYSNLLDDKDWMPRISGSGKPLFKAILTDNIMVVEAPLFKKEVADEVGSFDNRLYPAEDWEYFIRVAELGKCFHYFAPEETLVLVRWHPDSISQNQRSRRAVILLREKYAATLRDEELIELNSRLLAEYRALIKHEIIQRAIGEVKNGHSIKGAWQLTRVGLRSGKAKELFKMLFCSAAAFFAPRATFEETITAPASNTVAAIFRRRRPN